MAKVYHCKATWIVGEERFDATNTFQSGEVVVEEASFSIHLGSDFLAVLLVPVAIGACIRIYQNRQVGSSKPKPVKEKSNRSKTAQTRSADVEKIQIGCPECGRQLRVPSDYGGQVRCPDCENRFEVEPRVEHADEVEEEVEEEEVEERTTDEKVEVHCPECQQSLRIPQGYAGSIRCPACEEVFSAEQ